MAYYNLEDVRNAAKKISGDWNLVQDCPNNITVGIVEKHSLIKSITVGSDLLAEVGVHGIPASDMVNIQHKKLRAFTSEIDAMTVCLGVDDSKIRLSERAYGRENINYSVYSVSTSNEGHITTTTYFISKKCSRVTSENDSVCKNCKYVKQMLHRQLRRRQNKNKGDGFIAKKTPISCMARNSLRRALQTSRKESQVLMKKLKKVQKSLEKDSVLLSDDLHQSLATVMGENANKMGKFVKLFWLEQKKAFSCSLKGMRWHPMLIRFAIMLRSQSPSMYRTIREIGVLKLPGESVLKDYTNVIGPKTGINPSVLDEIKSEASKLPEEKRWVVLMHDEMSIKSDLVYDNRSSTLVGYVDSSSWKFSQQQNKYEDELATHVLSFMIVGITSSLKMSVAYFATKNATAGDLYPIFWEVVGCLEDYCKIKVNNNIFEG